MPTYITECYWPGVNERTLRASNLDVQRAAAELTGDGTPVRLLSSWLMPADDVAYFFFEGTADSVRAANERAAVPYERIVETIEIPAPPPDGRGRIE